MKYIPKQPLNSDEISDGIVTSAKLASGMVNDLTDVTITAADEILYGDTTDSNNIKKDTVQGILDLVSSSLSVNVDTFTIDQSTTGTQSVTGVGFQPTGIIAFGVQAGSGEVAWGFSDGTTDKALRDEYQQTAGSHSWSNSMLHLIQSSSKNSTVALTSFDSDGFTVTKAKTSTPTGTTQVIFMCLK